ncbi:hypothetical protein DID88_000650 [Monilinia fructigena]|uniref:Uncharacterized protein n=1 Tax=Monilinia fructigena TaxID=38457 RepID=A0A395IJE7_9HELO|nr:hypothetical protein DID88_000650 [Monilinia fructigena]
MASSVDPQEGTSTNPLQGQDSGYPSLPRVPSLDVISYPDLAFAEEDAEREYEILKRKWRMGIRPEDMVEENVSEYAYFKVQEADTSDRASATRKTPSYGGLKTRLYARPMAARVFSGGRSPQVKQPPESARKPSRRRNPDLIPRTPTGSPRLQPSLFENRPAQTGRFPVNPTVVPPPPSDPSDSHHSSPEGSPRGPPRGPPQRPPSGPPDGGDDPQGSEPDDRQPEKKDSNIGRDLSNLARLYTDNEKYSSEDDSFEYKYKIFVSHCSRIDIQPRFYLKAFPTMLTGIALEFYHANLDRLPQTMNDMRLMFETTFEGDEYHRGIMRKWETVALSDVIRKNPDQSVLECFRLMTAELRELYRGLTGDFREIPGVAPVAPVVPVSRSGLMQVVIPEIRQTRAVANAIPLSVSATYVNDDVSPDFTIYLNEDDESATFATTPDTSMMYQESRKKELQGLMESGVFELVKKSDIPLETRIFNSRFVDEIKNEGTDKAFPKSRLLYRHGRIKERVLFTQSRLFTR